MRDIIGMVLAGGRVEELSVLTDSRTKAAVPFGGQYLLIDFALSCLVQAGIEKLGVLSLYRPYSLISHLGAGEPWDLLGRGRGIEILPPYLTDKENQWYRGTADAVYQNIEFIQEQAPRDVLILSGDHVYHMDFGPVIEQHRRTNADLTMVVKEMDPAIGKGRFGFVQTDDQGKVVTYQDKAKSPSSRLVSLTIYLFKADVLIDRLAENVRTAGDHQLYSDVIPAMMERDRVFAFRHEGYWNYVRSVDAYYRAHTDLLGDDPAIRLDQWHVQTRRKLSGLGDLAPPRHSARSICQQSLVSPGCLIMGEVYDSILGPGVRVEEGAKVSASVLMQDVVVKPEAQVYKAILDQKVLIGKGAHLGRGDPNVPNHLLPDSLKSGIALIGAKTQVPEGALIGPNCVINPGLKAEAWETNVLEPGGSLGPQGKRI